MTLIYKIVPETLWREAEAAGVFAGAGVDLADGFIHFSTRAQVEETAARYFAGATACCWSPSRPSGSAPRCASSPRAAAICSRISTASCPSSRSSRVDPLPLRADGAHDFAGLLA